MKITLYPLAGLANRLRTIASALTIASKNEAKLELIWELSFELNCSFSKLFKPHDGINVVEYKTSHIKKSIFDRLQFYGKKIGVNLPSGYSTFLLNKDIKQLKSSGFDFYDLKNSKSIYIKTYEQLLSKDKDYSFIQPIESIERKIKSITSQYSSNTIGIHIRRTDNIKSIKHSPLESFIEIMESELKTNKDTLFYLATDSVKEQEVLIKKFGNKIIWREKVLDRDSDIGIQDAFLDLLCLSKTKKIIGSFASSFTEVAAELNQIELIQIIKS